MKLIRLTFLGILLSLVGSAQQAEVVVFRHDLRWVDETRFPNYFLMDEVRDSIFTATKHEISNYLNVSGIKFPEDVSYKIINGFGNQKVTMPKSTLGNDYEIGIYSFITRGTVGFSVLWKFNIIIKKKGKVLLKKEVIHELEYYNVSGYFTSVKWLERDTFHEIFMRMLKESLGVLPSSDEVIVIGSVDKLEAKAKELLPSSNRHLFKVDGNWRVADNFVAHLETPADTILNFKFKDKLSWEFPKPSFSSILAQLFSDMTNIEMVYDEAVKLQKKANLVFSDGEEVGILLKWIQIETRSTYSEEVESIRIDDPLVAELYAKDKQIGYFVYVHEELVYATENTKETFNAFNGYQVQNSLGVERIHRIEGMLYDRPVLVEYNENQGVIEVLSGEEQLGVMVIDNINPDNRSISNETLSKNKKFITASVRLNGPSLKNLNSQEWYPIYLPVGYSVESSKVCMESLIFLFFGMGNM